MGEKGNGIIAIFDLSKNSPTKNFNDFETGTRAC